MACDLCCWPHGDLTALFRFVRDDVREHGLRMRLVINEQEMADVTWRPNAGMESDEGISHHFHVLMGRWGVGLSNDVKGSRITRRGV